MNCAEDANFFTYIKELTLTREDLKDIIGNFLGYFLVSNNRKENIEKLRIVLEAIKQFVFDAIPAENIAEDLHLAVNAFEEHIGELLYGVEKNLKKARLFATSWMLAVVAMVLDRRWSVIFRTVM